MSKDTKKRKKLKKRKKSKKTSNDTNDTKKEDISITYNSPYKVKDFKFVWSKKYKSNINGHEIETDSN